MCLLRIPLSTLQIQRDTKTALLDLTLIKYRNMNDLNKLRRIVEDKEILESQLLNINSIFKLMSTAQIYSFDHVAVAKEITFLDHSLFQSLSLKDLTCSVNDRILITTSQVKQCIDFNLYLERILTSSIANSLNKTLTITSIIHIAFSLLFTFANLNGVYACLNALNSPYISKLNWNLSPNNLLIFKFLSTFVPLLESINSNHINLLERLLIDRYSRSSTTVIPFLYPLMLELHIINQNYVTGHEIVGNTRINILSDIGIKQHDKIIDLVSSCRGFKQHETNMSPITTTVEIDKIIKHDPFSSSFYRNHTRDLRIEHWLLTRVYFKLQDIFKCDLNFNEIHVEVFETKFDKVEEVVENLISDFDDFDVNETDIDMNFDGSSKEMSRDINFPNVPGEIN